MSAIMKKLVIKDQEFDVVDETARDAAQDAMTKVNSIIDDTTTADDTTWSSEKIDGELDDVRDYIGDIIDDTETDQNKTWSSTKIDGAIGDRLNWTYAGMAAGSAPSASVSVPVGANPTEIFVQMEWSQMAESIIILDSAMRHNNDYGDGKTYSTWLLGTTGRVSKVYITRTQQNGDWGYKIEDQSDTKKNMYVYYR